MKTKYLLLLLLLCFCLSCKKEEALPKATTNSSNTIGCKVNGKNWVADAGGSFSGKKYSLWFTHGKQFALSSYQIKDDDNTAVQIAIEKLTSAGTYYFNQDAMPYPDEVRFKNHATFERYKPNPTKRYVTNSKYTGWVNIARVDTINRIVAGTFEYTAVNLDGSVETIRITDGRFDIQY